MRFPGGVIGDRPHLSGPAYASPFADQAPCPEKIRLHVEPVEPAHVLHGVRAVQDDRVNHGFILHRILATKKLSDFRADFLPRNS